VLIALVALVMAGVVSALRPPVRPYSSVFDRFDPRVVLALQPGYAVRGLDQPWNAFNKRGGVAYKEWRGVVDAPGDDLPAIRGAIEAAITAYVTKVARGHCGIEGSLQPGPDDLPKDPRLPTHAMFRFNEGDRHGELHVWLVPDSSGKAVGYAIFLCDEPLE
jgi:hypothetical protein